MMRYNKQELVDLASQPSHKFDREGVLILRERQDGFFRRVEITQERWCRLRGNLLFYLAGPEQWCEPHGVIVLEQCTVRMCHDPQQDPLLWPFDIVFEMGPSYQMAAMSESERAGWLQAIQLAGYECMRSQMLALQQRIENKRGPDPDMDIYMWRLKRSQKFDINEVPLCELAMSCDNLLCDAHGRPPSSLLVIHVKVDTCLWIRYSSTEVVERNSNPSFLNTTSFRASDGLSGETMFRVTAYNLIERVTNTVVPIGSACILLSTIQDTQRLRIPLSSSEQTTVGFLTLNGWSLESSNHSSSPIHRATNDASVKTMTKLATPQKGLCHRRSQSLPPKLGVKIKLPRYGAVLKHLFSNAHQVTYRFHSGLGGDITVYEIMAESRLCFDIPQQLLQIFMQREKELLQEVICLGELGGQWKSWQMELLDTHLSLLRYYSHNKQSLQVFSNASQGKFFKQSSRKGDSNLEFSPVNLHMQRMWIHNDTLNKSGFYDNVTVGAFTAHTQKPGKDGGLLKLLQQMKDIPPSNESSFSSASFTRVKMACDAVQAIKQLRGEVVDIMRKLLALAKNKQPDGMTSLVEHMMSKTRVLLSLWDAGLVEEALAFIDMNKVASTPTSTEEAPQITHNGNERPHMLSPFKRLTQQLSMLDLKSPDIDDFATPCDPQKAPKWPQPKTPTNTHKVFGDKFDLGLQFYNNHFHDESASWSEYQSLHLLGRGAEHTSLPYQPDDVIWEAATLKKANSGSLMSRHLSDPSPIRNDSTARDENACNDRPAAREDPLIRVEKSQSMGKIREDVVEGNGNEHQLSTLMDNYGEQFLPSFLEGQSSPSANYYQPTDEPEPWDLTQLNIEASVMCLVSKVKFLSGRCGSPAVRLRGQRIASQQAFNRSKISPYSKQTEEFKTQKEGNTKTAVCDRTATLTATESVQKVVKKGNKFTDGLKLSEVSDWAAELRPPMRKLRQAMDGLLKGGRLAHAVLRLRCEPQERRRAAAELQMRRDACFSQALTAVTSGLLCWLWSIDADVVVKLLKAGLGPLCCFEGLLSLHGSEVAMWGDMVVAIEDLQTALFSLYSWDARSSSMPQVSGSRASITVKIPIRENLFTQLLENNTTSFTITPVFFNVGINKKAGIAESLSETGPQERSNIDNFDRLSEYYHRYKKLTLPDCIGGPSRATSRLLPLGDVIESLRMVTHAKVPKNVEILQLSSHAARRMNGVKVTSCKSAKDRTGMSCTLEQCHILANEYHLAEHEFERALDCLRSEGCRRENTYKNVGIRKYAFDKLQRIALPKDYKPPIGTFGSIQS